MLSFSSLKNIAEKLLVGTLRIPIHSASWHARSQQVACQTISKHHMAKAFCCVTREKKLDDSVLQAQNNKTSPLIQEDQFVKLSNNINLSDADWHCIGDAAEFEELDEFKGISLKKGVTGVFDIEEFIEILNQEKLEKIAVISIPSQLQYVDYMVITTGRSPKQMTAVAEFIRKIFKKRCSDSTLVIEGKNNKDWIALDLGNIALHIFSSKFRKMYDLETLWTCGVEYDDLSNEKESTLSALVSNYNFPQ